MNKNIKGITVEIGGDTAPLGKALKSVEATGKSLQSELKEVNRQLKFDPNSTVLLKQKQDLLRQSTENLREKQAALKQAVEQAHVQFEKGDLGAEKARAVEREYEKVTSQLKETERAAEKAAQKLDLLGEKAEKINGFMKNTGKAALGVGAAVGTAAVKLSADYEDSLAKVSTIADTSKKSLEELSGEVMQISNSTGTAADEINEALYQAISAGADTAKATELVDVAVRAAKGGFTDTATAVDGLTSVLNTYGMKTEEAEGLANQFLVTQNLGKTTFGELAGSIGKVAPTAAAAGVQTNELLSSIAALTANGINTAESVTGMKAALSNIIKPGAEAAKLARSLGLDFSAAALQTQGLSGFLETLKEKTGGNLDTMSKLFGSTEALNAVLTLTSDNGMALMQKSMDEMQSNTTAVEDAFNKVKGTSAEAWKDIANTGKNLLIELGGNMQPVMNELLNLARWLLDNKEAVCTALITIAGLLAGFNVAVMIQGVVQAFQTWKLATEGMTIAQKLLNLAMMANPAALVVGAITALVAAIVYLWNTNEDFRNFLINLWEGIKSTFGTIIDGIASFFTKTIPEAWNSLVAFFAGVPAWWNGLWSQVGQFFTNLWNGIISFFTQTIPQWIEQIKGFFNQLPYYIGLAIGDMLGHIVKFGMDAWNWVTTELPKIIQGIVDWFSKLPGQIWNWLCQVVTNIAKWGQDSWNSSVQWAQKIINGIGEWFQKLPSSIWKWLCDTVINVVKWGGDMLTQGKKAATDLFNAIVNTVKELPNKMLDIGRNIVEGIWNGIKNAGNWIKDQISGFCGGLVDGFKNALGVHSPSRVFAEQIGQFIPQGIWSGIDGWMPKLKKNLAASVAQMVSGASMQVSVLPAELSKSPYLPAYAAAGGQPTERPKESAPIQFHIEHFENNRPQDVPNLMREFETVVKHIEKSRG